MQKRIGVELSSPTCLIRYRLFYRREILLLSGCGVSTESRMVKIHLPSSPRDLDAFAVFISSCTSTLISTGILCKEIASQEVIGI